MKITNLVLIGSLAYALAGSVAFADCNEKYVQVEEGHQSDETHDLVVGVVVGAVLGPVGSLSTTSALSDDSQANAADKVLSLLDDAQNGSGVVLNQFSKDLRWTVAKSAAFIVAANHKNAFCNDGKHLMSYNEIVAYAQGSQ